MAHHKHAKLKRPASGSFHRNEFAFLGSNCKLLQMLMSDLSKKLNYNICLIDEEHSLDNHDCSFKIENYRYDFDFNLHRSFIDDRIITQAADAAFVNGNHFSAEKQIVIIDKEKKESLKKRIPRLTNIQAVILKDDVSEPFDFILDIISRETPILSWSQQNDLLKIISEVIDQEIPSVYGLVLAGGKSQRMGADKSQLDYHGKPQETHLLDLFDKIGMPAFLSKKNNNNNDDSRTITDTFDGLGPFGAICSAFRADPDRAYLVVACDLPFVDENALQTLIEERDPSKIATCYHSVNKEFPDPLLAIYEPRAYSRFLSFLSLGYSCPRKILINSDIKSIKTDQDKILLNVNTPEELESYRKHSDSMDAHSPS